MNKKVSFTLTLLGILLLGTLAYSQVAGIPTFPPNFSYSLPSMPLPQSPNQIIFNNCPYKNPIEFKSLKVYDINGTVLNPTITAQLTIYTNARRNVCSYKKTFSVAPALNSGALVSNFVSALNTEVLSQANANAQPPSSPPPISTGS